MLTLDVHVNEYVQIGPDIRVCVLRNKRGLMRLSIDAPNSVKIVRSSLVGKIIGRRKIPPATGQCGVCRADECSCEFLT